MYDQGRGANPRPCAFWPDDTGMTTDLGFIHRFVPGTDSRPPPLAAPARLRRRRARSDPARPSGSRPGARCVSPRGKVNEQGITRFFRRARRRRLGPRRSQSCAPPSSPTSCAAPAAPMGCRSPIALGYSNGANIGWSLLLEGARRARRRDPVARHAAVRSASAARSQRHPGAADRRRHDDELDSGRARGPAGGPARRGRRRRRPTRCCAPATA